MCSNTAHSRRSKMQYILMIAVGVILFGVVVIYVWSFTAGRPSNLGVSDGQLAPVPESPNAVSTQTDQESAEMEPLVVPASCTKPIDQAAGVLRGMGASEIVTQSSDYLHAEFTSSIFRFTDDVELYFDAATRLLHFRSASRIGHSDLGVNRERMETFSRRFGAEVSPQ